MYAGIVFEPPPLYYTLVAVVVIKSVVTGQAPVWYTVDFRRILHAAVCFFCSIPFSTNIVKFSCFGASEGKMDEQNTHISYSCRNSCPRQKM